MRQEVLAYVVGVAIGDGNLSNPNGRAVRLRITCDVKYPELVQDMRSAIQTVMPSNKVSLIRKKDCAIDISCYSNRWEDLLGWRADGGSKYHQNVRVPTWIKDNESYSIACLRGLFQTDGAIYKDRQYVMVTFTTIISDLAHDVMSLMGSLGFQPRLYSVAMRRHRRYNIRLCRGVNSFITRVGLYKR